MKATVEDLDTIGNAVQLLNMSPPQLTISVKAMEVPVTAMRDGSLGFGLTRQLATNPAPSQEAFTNSGKPTLQGVLTPSQFQSLIQTLEKAGGTDLMNAPEVTTLSGRQAEIKVVDVRYIVTSLDDGTNYVAKRPAVLANGVFTVGKPDDPVPIAELFELGPIIDIVPYVEADGYTIRMTVLPKLREFLGYDKPPKALWAAGGPYAPPDPDLSQPVPLPRFRLRETTATARVWDGQTLVLGAGTARHVTVDKNSRTTATNYAEKALFVFITPRLIDPAGNRLHSDEELQKLERVEQRKVEGQPSLLNSGERKIAPSGR